MSNVVKMTRLRKRSRTSTSGKSRSRCMATGMTDRMHDAIRLADEEANDEGIPEEFADCAILGVFTSMLVTITAQRKVIGPDALIKLIRLWCGAADGERQDDARADDRAQQQTA